MSQLVSIIITTYNRSDLIMEAVQSCLRQTYAHTEIIVVDDGSTDNTKDVLADLANGNQVRYHYKQNAERAAARNTGMMLAKGTYVKFLDSDDLIEPDYISACITYFEAHRECDLVHTNCKILHQNGSVTPATKKGITGNVFNILWEFNDISLSAVMMKKAAFEKWGGLDETRSLSGAEDWEYWVRLAKQGCIVGFVPAYLSVIRTHADNGTMNDIDKIVYSTQEGQRLLNEKFDIPPALNHKLEMRLIYLKAVYSYIGGQRINSLRYLLKAGSKDKRLFFKGTFWLLASKNFFPKKLAGAAKKLLKK